jgi:hypothetical protein
VSHCSVDLVIIKPATIGLCRMNLGGGSRPCESPAPLSGLR